VLHDKLEIGAVVAFISAIRRLNDPRGDLLNYYREVIRNRVKYRLLAGAANLPAAETGGLEIVPSPPARATAAI
jgi:hypothetical protein